MRLLYAYLRRSLAHTVGPSGLVACLFWALIGPAFGQSSPNWTLVPKAAESATGVTYSYSPSAAGNAVSTVSRGVTAAANDALMVADRAVLSTPAGDASVYLSRALSGGVARGALVDAALTIGRGGLAAGAAVVAAQYLGDKLEQWMLDQGYHKNSDGSWGVGAQQPGQVVGPGWWIVNGVKTLGSSDVSAIHLAYPDWGKLTPCSAQPTDGSECFDVYRYGDNYSLPPAYPNVVVYLSTASTTLCPTGFTEVSPGVCGSSSGGPASLDPSAVHAAAAAAPNPPLVTDWAQALQSAADLGAPAQLPDAVNVTGDATVTGASTVTNTRTITQPDGTTQTLTETQQEVSHLTYNGPQVAIDTHTVTSTQNPDGSTTKTDKPVATAPDACAGFPGILGCTSLGTPETANVPASSKSIAFTAESISLPSACPAPVGMGRFGSLSFQPACDSAGYMRPLILAGSAITALMICVAAVAGVKT